MLLTFFRRTIGTFALVAIATLLAVLLASSSVNAAPALPHVFGDRMVLQRDAPILIWGWADPGEKITVTLGGAQAFATANAQRDWRVELPPTHAGGPFTLTVSGTTTIRYTNVLIGEVWLASGQSNMVFALHNAADGAEAAAHANLPEVRFFTVPKKIAVEPQKDTRSAEWQICTPETAKDFSAVAYFFAADLQKKLGVPVGIVLSAWSGSAAEEWTSPDALRSKPILSSILRKWDAEPAAVKSFAAAPAHFQIDFDGFELVPTTGTTANPVTLSDFSAGFARGADGGTWSYDWGEGPRTWFELTSPGRGDRKFALRTEGELDGTNASFLNFSYRPNDAPLGLTAYEGVKFWARGDGAFQFQSLQPTIYDWDNYAGAIVPLTREWKQYKVRFADLKQDGWGVVEPFTPASLTGFRLLSMTPQGETDRPPSGMYEGMITPLAPFQIRGALWYQGESNGDRGFQYRALLPALISSWRDLWKAPGLPFLVIQLPNHGSSPELGDSEWAEVREAQILTASTTPDVGLVVTIDVGDPKNVHPARKHEVGSRAAEWALNAVYGNKTANQSPIFESAQIKGNAIVARFKPTNSPLAIHNGAVLTGFTIAGSDRKFHRADARIVGDTVEISSSEVPAPVAARYDWMDDPSGNLANTAGLPASPFRTDDWPGISPRN